MIRLSKPFHVTSVSIERWYQRRLVGRPYQDLTSHAAIDRQGPPPDPGPDPGGGQTRTIKPPNGPSPSTSFLLSKPHASRTTTLQKGFPMNHRSSLRRHSLVATALCTALLACNASRSQAASFTWTGAGANGSWSTAANWAPSGITTGTTPHTVTYNNNVNTTGTVAAEYTLTSLDFTNTAGAFTINGNSPTRFIRMQGNITNSSTATQTINTILAYPQAVSSTGTFTIGGSGNILLANSIRSGPAVTVNVVGTGTVSLASVAPSIAFAGTLATTESGILEIGTDGVIINGGYVNNGSLFVNGGFAMNQMTLNSSGTVSFAVPADPNLVNTIQYGDGSSYGGTLSVNLSGTYANTGTSPTLANPISFQLFVNTNELATGGFTAVRGSYAETNLTFTEIGTTGYWYSNAIVGGAQDGQYVTFAENTGLLMIVPEPSAVVIAGVGVALAGWRMARRRKGGKPSA